MTTHSHLLRCGTMGGAQRILAAAKHNLREIPCPSADDALSTCNRVLLGPTSAREVAELAKTRTAALGIDPKKLSRKNATRMGEIIFGLPATTSVDTDAYFRACVAWAEGAFGADALLSAVIHYDEAAPHCQVLMLPVRHGQWLASLVFGGKQELRAMHNQFFAQVAAGFGLSRAPARLTAAARRDLAAAVLAYLQASDDPVRHSPVWSLVRDEIGRDPGPWAEQLGVSVAQHLKTMAEIFTGTGKGSDRQDAIADSAGRASKCSPVLADLGKRHAGTLADFSVEHQATAIQAGANEPGSSGPAQPDRGPAASWPVPSPTPTKLASSGGGPTESAAAGASGPPEFRHHPRSKYAAGTQRNGLVQEPTDRPGDAAPDGNGAHPPQLPPQASQDPATAHVQATPSTIAPSPLEGAPKRLAGTLRLTAVRDRRAAAKNAGTTVAAAVSARVSVETAITRDRETTMTADTWDGDLGEFRTPTRPHAGGQWARASGGDGPAVDAHHGRHREDRLPAEAWDSALGEHVLAVRVAPNSCRL